LAENALPTRNLKTAMPRYSQALMDLGATLCLPRKPNCQACPVQNECKAFALGEPEKFPVKTRKIKRSSEVLWLLLAQNAKGEVWLEKRPPKGIWASLYSLPLFDSEAALRTVFDNHSKLKKSDKTAAPNSSSAPDLEVLPAFKHVLTHKDLHCHVVKVQLKKAPHTPNAGAWFSEKDWAVLGLPTPVRHLLSNSL
jgi:A/G-specific adenine glycosylase